MSFDKSFNLSFLLNEDCVSQTKKCLLELDEKDSGSDLSIYCYYWQDIRQHYLQTVCEMHPERLYDILETREDFIVEKDKIVDLVSKLNIKTYLTDPSNRIEKISRKNLSTYEDSLGTALDRVDVALGHLVMNRSHEIFNAVASYREIERKVSNLTTCVSRLKSSTSQLQSAYSRHCRIFSIIYLFRKFGKVFKVIKEVKKIEVTISMLSSMMESHEILKLSCLIPLLYDVIDISFFQLKVSRYLRVKLQTLTEEYILILNNLYSSLTDEMIAVSFKNACNSLPIQSNTNEVIHDFCSLIHFEDSHLSRLELILECFYKIGDYRFVESIPNRLEKFVCKILKRFEEFTPFEISSHDYSKFPSNAIFSELEFERLIDHCKICLRIFKLLTQKLTEIFINLHQSKENESSMIVCRGNESSHHLIFSMLRNKNDILMSNMIHLILTRVCTISHKYVGCLNTSFSGSSIEIERLRVFWISALSLCDLCNLIQPIANFLNASSECNPLRRKIISIMTIICDHYVKTRLNKIKLLLENEAWERVDVPFQLQTMTDLLFDLNFTSIETHPNLSPVSSSNLSNDDALNSEILGDIQNYLMDNTSSYLKIENTEYPVTSSTIFFLQTIYEFCNLSSNAQFLSPFLFQRLLDTFILFNSMSYSLIVEGKAIKISGMKNINLRHLVLSFRCCKIISIFSNVTIRYFTRTICSLPQYNVFPDPIEEFSDEILEFQKSISQHQTKLFEEMVFILENMVNKHVLSWNVCGSHPSTFIQWVVSKIKKFINNLEELLESNELEDVLHVCCVSIVRILTSYLSQISIDTFSQVSVYQNNVLPELHYLCEQMAKLSQIRQDTIALFEELWSDHSKLIKDRLKK